MQRVGPESCDNVAVSMYIICIQCMCILVYVCTHLQQSYDRLRACEHYNVPNYMYIHTRSSARGLSASYIPTYNIFIYIHNISYALCVIITIPVSTDFSDKRRC